MPEVKFKIAIQKAKVISNEKIKDRYYKIIIHAPKVAHSSVPGQFLEVKINHNFEPFLRRPFSIHRVDGPCIEVFYKIVGKGTEMLSQKQIGEYLDVMGPLGNGFNYKSVNKSAVLVAGGMGVAPLIFLAEKIMGHKMRRQAKRKMSVLIGATTKNQILCEREFKQLGYEVTISTDDGSRGFKGKVTDLLRNVLRTTQEIVADTMIYACGPRPMLKEVIHISEKHNIPAQISLEGHMACGIGACLGCVINTKDGYKRVCKEGPVFEAKKIIWGGITI